MHNQQQLIIFARAPEYGSVKTRLAADIGKQEALDFYTATLTVLLKNMHDKRWDLTVSTATASATNHAFFKNHHTLVQPEGDLGHRMAKVLDHFLGSPRVIIGSDIPAIRPAHIKRAFEALLDHDVVFGPASDGGFWLVGCSADFIADSSADNAFMKNVAWSTDHTLADTLATLPVDCRVATLSTLEDVDDVDSYQRYLNNSEAGFDT